MPLVLILPREWAILAARCVDEAHANAPIMHALDSDIFQYLCSHTDWATGRIGQQSTLSYAGIAVALNEDIPRKPSKALRRVKRRCVRNSVERLIKAGLLLRQSVSGMCDGVSKNSLQLDRVFWCALLMTDDFAKNPDSRQIAGLMTELMKNKPFSNSHLNKNRSLINSDRYRSVSTYKTNPLTNAKKHVFRLTLAWQPDRKFVDSFLRASGFSDQQIEKVWFGKYVQYWSTQEIERSQREWSAHFANHMQSYLLRPGYFEGVNGMVQAE